MGHEFNIVQLLHDLFFDYTLRNIALGAAILGAVSGILGSFALLRRQSLLGDALSHAALPGVCLAFIISGESKSPLVLLTGAAVAGWFGAALLSVITRNTRLKEDAAMGIILSVFFGVGYFILSILQRSAGSAQAGLDSYLFGSAASLVASDVQTMALLGIVAAGITLVFFKEFKVLAFDPDFLATQGFPVRGLDVVLTSLIVIAVMIGLQTVGVVLMSAMLIAPGAAARQWTNRLGVMLASAATIGAISGVLGAVVSLVGVVPTGPAIILTLTALTIVSFLFGSERGMVWTWLRTRRSQAGIRVESVLGDLLHIAERHKDRGYAAPTGLIGTGKMLSTLRKMAARGLVTEHSNDTWSLTAEGYNEALRAAQSHRGITTEPVETGTSVPAMGR